MLREAALWMQRSASTNKGPMIFAPMSIIRAINRHRVNEFDTSRKPQHWGKRKLKRDQ